MRHKHADLIHAWAENMDLQIECKYTGESSWTQFDPVMQKWMPHHEYRIKPVENPDVVCYYTASPNHRGDSVKLERDNLILTFDGETGKLKSAEVIK